MKTVVIHAAKDLRIEEREPEAVSSGQVEIAIEAGGICGSDLHYYNHGGIGAIRLREPMILGHEVAGTITALGNGVSGLAIGDQVAVSPSRPCNACQYCLKGMQNHCLNMRFMAAPCPCHIFRVPFVKDWSPKAGNATRSATVSPFTRLHLLNLWL